MNRDARRQFARSMKKARLESAEITAYCGWPRCRRPVAVAVEGETVNGFEFASAALRKHYEDEHGGAEPQPIEGACFRCKRHTSWVPGTVLMLCPECKVAERTT